MKTLKPIGIETQIEDLLSGQSTENKKLLLTKIEQVKKNLHKIKKINGTPVFDPVVEDKYINYNLTETSEEIKRLFPTRGRTHYYPIQYADVEIE